MIAEREAAPGALRLLDHQGGDLLLPVNRAEGDPVERQNHHRAQGDLRAPLPLRPPPGQAPAAGLPQDPGRRANPGAPVPGQPDPQRVTGPRAQPAGRPLGEHVAGQQRGRQGQDEEHGAQDETRGVGAPAVPDAAQGHGTPRLRWRCWERHHDTWTISARCPTPSRSPECGCACGRGSGSPLMRLRGGPVTDFRHDQARAGS